MKQPKTQKELDTVFRLVDELETRLREVAAPGDVIDLLLELRKELTQSFARPKSLNAADPCAP